MDNEVRLRVVFYRTETGSEPVRKWLKSLSRQDRKAIGEDIKTVQFRWPLAMPLVRKLESDLWEVRSRLHNRIARTIFTIEDGVMVLLHGFIKKAPKTPKRDLALAKRRAAKLRGHS
jgi:phage-related protein